MIQRMTGEGEGGRGKGEGGGLEMQREGKWGGMGKGKGTHANDIGVTESNQISVRRYFIIVNPCKRLSDGIGFNETNNSNQGSLNHQFFKHFKFPKSRRFRKTVKSALDISLLYLNIIFPTPNK